MLKKGWILLLFLLGVAFLISCGNRRTEEREKAELIRIERIPESSAFHLSENSESILLKRQQDLLSEKKID